MKQAPLGQRILSPAAKFFWDLSKPLLAGSS
jgi:hypothetical protein